uniref:Uncharacterized protein n=1 Tax=Romanomermis culicivorax TaxID=13658 RepID=A0A915K7D7_ROMCU
MKQQRNLQSGKVQSLPGSIEEEEEHQEANDIIVQNNGDKSIYLRREKLPEKKQKTWGLSRSFDTYQLDDLNLIDEDQILADGGKTNVSANTDHQNYDKPSANGRLLQDIIALNPMNQDLERKFSDTSFIDYKPFTKSEMSLFDKQDLYSKHSKFDPPFPHHTKTSLLRLKIGEIAHRKAVEDDIQFRLERTRTEYRRFDYRSVPLSPKVPKSPSANNQSKLGPRKT